MHRPTSFASFFSGGFECSSHRRHDGRRLDLIAATGHDRHAETDYRALRAHGLRTVRDGVRWHLIERRPGEYDWSSFLPMLKAAQRTGTQVIWDLCHYGWPDDIDVWRPEFVDRFAAFSRAFAALLRDHGESAPYCSPVNEISYLSWAGGEMARINPMGAGRGLELKHQLVRAAIASIEAIREVSPNSRFVQIDPLVNVVSPSPAQVPDAASLNRAQYDGWLMLSGELWPGLGGDPSYLDLIGVNFYADNQWYMGGGTIRPGEPDYRPFHEMLQEVHQRFKRPVMVAETGAEGEGRAAWFQQVYEQVTIAMHAGTPVEGMCLYPVVDYPGWADERHCECGLLGAPNASGQRPVHEPLAEQLERSLRRCAGRPEPATAPVFASACE